MKCCSATVLIGLAATLCGCPQSTYVDALPTTAEAVDRIRSDANLTAQEKREELRRLGLSDGTINAYLRSDRTGNQFGGDLRSALEKIRAGRFSDLTPDEVQIYGDAAQVVDAGIQTIGDAQAEAIEEFFESEGLNTADNLRDFLNDPGQEVPSSIPDGILQTLFVDFDPADVEDQL
jgi:hypothetical protein